MIKTQLQVHQRAAYERYINTLINAPNNEKARIDSLQDFVEGSPEYEFLYLLTKQNLTQGKLSPDDQKLRDEYCHALKEGWGQIATRQKLLDYDNAGNEADRKKILEDIIINTIHYVQPQNHQKPYHQEHQVVNKGQDGEVEIQSKKNATLDQSILQKDFIKDIKEKLKNVARDSNNNRLQHLNTSLQLLQQMPLYLAHTVDFAIFHEDAVMRYAEDQAQNNQVAGIINPSFLAQIKVAMAGRRKENQYNEVISTELCNMMSLEQLNQLKGSTQGYTDSNIIGACFSKQYCEELSEENQAVWTNDQKYENLLKLYNAVNSDNLPRSLRQQLLVQLLALGPKVGKYNKDHFTKLRKYQEERHESGGVMSALGNALKQKMFESHHHVDWSRFVNKILDPSVSIDNSSDLVTQYLLHYAYESRGDLSEFKQKSANYITVDRINEIEDRVRVYQSTQGLKDLKLNTSISADQFKRICDEVCLTFLPNNRDKFKVDELVEIHLEIKNVQTLHCKVFEFNTLTYYRKTLKPFDTSVDLDGLESTIVRTFDFNVAPNCKQRVKYDFAELGGKVGLFIIEFVGNGKSARAVIKKGSLSLIHRSTPAGHWATIIDDNRKVCKGDKTGLWFDKKFYAAKDDGSVFIPYGQQELSTKVIMVHGDFAQLGEFTRKSENYSLTCQFYLNDESVMVGSTCQVLVTPMLFINGRRADLKLLQNITAVIKTQDFIDETPTTKTFSNLKISSDQDLTLSFQVPPNLRSIKVKLTCQVLNTTTKTMQDFSDERHFQIATFENVQQVHEYHLRVVADNKYELLVLGKNGEPKPLAPQKLYLQHAYNGQVEADLTSDEHGKIYLGHLDQVLQLRVSGGRSWLLPNLKGDNWSYPAKIDTVQGKSIEIPIAHMWDSAKPDQLDRRQVSLTRSIHGIVIQDWFSKIKVVKKQNIQSHYYTLVVDNLESGEYHLFIRGQTDQKIEIKVHSGTYLDQTGSFILKKNCLQELVTSQKMVKITQSQLVDKSELQLKLADYSKNARVHVMATHFLPTNIESALNMIKGAQQNQIACSVFTFAKWTNLLLSDRELSDEYRYVFDRASAERNLGNSLDRPSLLNKRIFTRKTEVDQEVLSSGSKFQSRQEDMMMVQNIMPQAMDYQGFGGRQYMAQNIQPHMMQQQIMGHAEQMVYGGGGRQYRQPGSTTHDSRNAQVLDYITDYQNFLRDSPLVALNLKPDQEGVITFKHDKLSSYSSIQILVVDESSCMQSVRNLQSLSEPQKRDLSLKKSLNESKGLTQSREHQCLESGQKTFIEDITSSEVMLVDDLTKIGQILTEISQMNGMHPGSSEWDKLSFVKSWETLTKDQKNFYFGEYQCHELNFFIKKHDSAYFNGTVRPFLEFKMEKSFVDLYLLDNDSRILEMYQQLHKFSHLNAFEKCLLVQVLSRNEKRSLAENLVKLMKNRVEANQEVLGENKEVFNRIFDLVLNMNSTSKAKPGSLAAYATTVTASINAPRRGPPGAPSYPGAMNDLIQMAPQSNMRRSSLLAQERCYEQEEADDDCAMSYDDCFGEEAAVFSSSKMMAQRQVNLHQEKFEQLEATKEYMETFYYDTKLKGGKETQHLVKENRFWCDYADFLLSSQTTFISQNFTECISPIEKFLCQTVLDMKSVTQASVHQYVADESRGVTIVAGSSVIIFKKEIKEVEVDIQQDFMVTHRYTRIDAYGKSNRSDDDDAIPSEFLINVPYECEVIMTNVSPHTATFNLLYQIPIGSMPIMRTKFMKSQPLELGSYSTKRLAFQFYFPKVGKFGHYPSNVSIGDKVTARGTFNTLNVVERRNIQQDAAELNFDDLVQVGTQDQILDFLKTRNILISEKGFRFDKIYYLLKEKDFWTKAIRILREREIYEQQVWNYAFLHRDLPTIKDYLKRENAQIGQLANIKGHFQSTLFTTQPEKQHGQLFVKMLEYNPMINSRAHKIGKDNQRHILNKTFRQTYDQFLQTMALKRELTFEDKMVYVYYLQLQDRIPEAIKLFNQLELQEAHNTDTTDASTLQIQYDYLAAYFDFFTGAEDGYKLARRIVQRYDNYPVSNWKMMFLAIEDLLNDFDGEFDMMSQGGDYDSEFTGSEASLKERKQENMKQSKSKEPVLSSTQIDEQGTLTIETCNIRTVVVKYYMIDAEILHSRAPFLKDNATEFSYVKPCLQTAVVMQDSAASEEEMAQFVTQKVSLVEQLKHKNLVIEINGDGKQEFKTFYSSALKIQINEAFGELKVMHADKGLGKIYVKVFQMSNSGKESFFRDGYTDIRGKFEYASSSGNGKLNQIKKFSILVQSEEFGSQIREVNPPKDETITPQVGTSDPYQILPSQSNTNSMQAMKQNRMINRNNYVQSKRK